MIKAVRRHMGRILRSIDADAFERKGIHSEHGPVTLADLLQRASDHIPHHGQYIEENRKALKVRRARLPFHLAGVGSEMSTSRLEVQWLPGKLRRCAFPAV